MGEANGTTEYWGVWAEETPYGFAVFLSDNGGRLLYYPDEEIAKAHAGQVNCDGGKCRARSFREFNESEAQR